MQRHNRRAPTFVVLRVLLFQPAGDCVHLCLSLFQVDAWLETGDNDGVMLSPDGAFFVCPGHRRPHLGKVGKAEAGRHDSGNQVALPVHVDVVPDDVSIRAEVVLPETVAENHHVRAAWLIFLWKEHTPQHRLNAQGRKEARRHRAGVDLFRFLAAGQSETAVIVVDRHLLEDLVLALPIQVVGR